MLIHAIEKNRGDKRIEGENVISNKEFKEGFTKDITSEQKSKSNEGARTLSTGEHWGQRGQQHKGPGAGTGLSWGMTASISVGSPWKAGKGITTQRELSNCGWEKKKERGHHIVSRFWGWILGMEEIRISFIKLEKNMWLILCPIFLALKDTLLMEVSQEIWRFFFFAFWFWVEKQGFFFFF